MDTDALARGLLASEGDAMLAVDRDGVIRIWNPGAVRIFGFSQAEAVGAPLDLIIPENLRARHNEGFAKVMVTGHTRYGSGDLLAVPAMTRSGRRISVEFTIMMLHDSKGARDGMAAILRDVTQKFEETRSLRKRIAELQAGAHG
ncbi:PAS domain S-box-containing protein [Rhodoblastus acidophilus]|uniref:PAS domain S-box protein n=1 Tax=Rhodoblastus acidophilus TaxID=1074 RepID=UPI002224EDBA|nr:PAS domain S-box protein [Rhodoblastus acidophilus]MCW2285964.1 PAS domain S-box-containing protein [Rhodoblastus acidophilus]MCW2334858.1 PAS domain S-box-containing protein [Rhodoblastus acidophilus]